MTKISNNQKNIQPQQRKWWSRYGPWLVGLGTAWGLFIAIFASISDSTPEAFTLTASVWFAAAYTLALYIIRRWWLPRFAMHPLRNAIILGIFNAAVIETEFLVFEKIFGAEGVAAHPNLIIDLILTMPWYSLMVITFVKVQHRWRFSAATVLLLGGIYELGGDGIVGALMDAFEGSSHLFTLEYWIMMALMMFWHFIPIYSSIVLPPAWLVARSEPPPHPTTPAWRAALKPMLWLIPFTFYVLVVTLIIFVVSGVDHL